MPLYTLTADDSTATSSPRPSMRAAQLTSAELAATSKANPRSLLADLTAELARLDPSAAVPVRAV